MDRGRQILRQWKLLRLLEQSRLGVTVPELCDSTGDGATKRTIYRDLEQLRQVGFPLENENGRWRVHAAAKRGWAVPFDPSHVLALKLTSRLLRPIQSTWLAEPLKELQERLEVLLTDAGRGYCDELEQHMAATLFTPIVTDPDSAEQGARIDEALNKEHRLRIRYESLKNEVTERIVDPYATWFADGRLYLVGLCHEAKDYRTFAVQRIRSAEVLDETFDRSPEFDLERFVVTGFGVFHDAPLQVVLRFAADVAYLPRERLLHETQQLEPLEDGALLVRMTVGGLPELAAWIVGFGGKVRAVAPPTLVDEVVRRYRAGLAAQIPE